MSPSAPGRTAQMRVILPFAIVTLIWGSTWIVIRDQLGTVPPAWSVAYRFALAGVVMLGWAALRRDRLRLDRAELILALAIGLSQFALNFNLVYAAEGYITSGLVAVLFALLLVPNALLARIFFGQGVSRRFLGGSAIALAGVALLFAHELDAARAGTADVAIGVALTLLAVLSASSANIMQLSAPARTAPTSTLLAWAMILGALLDGGWALATAGAPRFDWRPGYVSGLVYLALIGSVLTFPLYFGLIRSIGAARAAYSGVLIPVIAMALSTLFEDYRWSWPAIGGGLLVIAGLIVANKARSPAR